MSVDTRHLLKGAEPRASLDARIVRNTNEDDGSDALVVLTFDGVPFLTIEVGEPHPYDDVSQARAVVTALVPRRSLGDPARDTVDPVDVTMTSTFITPARLIAGHWEP